MLLKGKNNASGQLYEALSGGSATCKITSGHTFTGIEFPFNMTIYDLDTNGNPINYEIVQVASITPNTGYDTFSITRAQEGTSDVGHLIGKRCANLITYAIVDGINDKFDQIDADVGDISTLTTTDKTSVVNAINENVSQLAEIENVQLPLKANKIQENWITPTLINNWSLALNGDVAYYKDNFNIVRLKGYLQPGNSYCFILPVGYRPFRTINTPCVIDGVTSGYVVIFGNGRVYPFISEAKPVYLDGVSFRGEV